MPLTATASMRYSKAPTEVRNVVPTCGPPFQQRSPEWDLAHWKRRRLARGFLFLERLDSVKPLSRRVVEASRVGGVVRTVLDALRIAYLAERWRQARSPLTPLQGGREVHAPGDFVYGVPLRTVSPAVRHTKKPTVMAVYHRHR